MTREQLLAFFDRKIAVGAPEARRLSTHVFSQSIAPAALTVEAVPDEYYPRPPERTPGEVVEA